jgi:hypothetical protein
VPCNAAAMSIVQNGKVLLSIRAKRSVRLKGANLQFSVNANGTFV